MVPRRWFRLGQSGDRPSSSFLAASAGCIALAMLTTGCETMDKRDTDIALAGTMWSLIEVRSNDGATSLNAEQQQRHTISFNADGSVALKLDCNSGRSSWSERERHSKGGKIVIGPIASTRAFCAPPTWGDVLTRELSSTSGRDFSLTDQTLLISGGNVELRFSRIDQNRN